MPSSRPGGGWSTPTINFQRRHEIQWDFPFDSGLGHALSLLFSPSVDQDPWIILLEKNSALNPLIILPVLFVKRSRIPISRLLKLRYPPKKAKPELIPKPTEVQRSSCSDRARKPSKGLVANGLKSDGKVWWRMVHVQNSLTLQVGETRSIRG
ncbi:hypothetical protein B0H19DRAFT_1078822 [Mycena capillaripes]|nr:hypothetical protein B0H19DRAFT_1078822 [Mycena capillaripes]